MKRHDIDLLVEHRLAVRDGYEILQTRHRESQVPVVNDSWTEWEDVPLVDE